MNGIAFALHAMRVKPTRTILKEQPMSSADSAESVPETRRAPMLNNVYAGDRFRGGFFPNGVSGAFNSVTAL